MLEKGREFLHKRKCQEQKSSKGYAAQVVAREEWGSKSGAKEEAVARRPIRVFSPRM